MPVAPMRTALSWALGRAGTAWTCTGDPLDCGPHPVSPHPNQGDDPHVVLYEERNEAGYDGELYVVELTAAPPAVQEPGQRWPERG
jgi:hypothetical protein